jgi:hypothetical protein
MLPNALIDGYLACGTSNKPRKRASHAADAHQKRVFKWNGTMTVPRKTRGGKRTTEQAFS